MVKYAEIYKHTYINIHTFFIIITYVHCSEQVRGQRPIGHKSACSTATRKWQDATEKQKQTEKKKREEKQVTRNDYTHTFETLQT